MKIRHHGLLGVHRYYRTKRARKFLKGKVLDVGCSDGALLSLYSNIVGIDTDRDKLEIAKKFGEVKEGSVLKIPFPDNSFDTVTCLSVLFSIDNRELAYKELARVSKQRIIISDIIKKLKPIDKLSDFDYIKKIPVFEKFLLIHKEYLPSSKLIKYKGTHLNNEKHMEKISKKWYFIIYRLLRPIMIGYFLLRGKITKDTIFLVYDKKD
ncbi:MAG: methyltransferase domain-containing protein [Nanoarchaeota archaeon]